MSTHRIWRDGLTLEFFTERSANTSSAHLGIRFTELGDDYLRGEMQVDSRTCQPMRILHGGASVLFAETLGSLGANGVVDITKYHCVGQEINANHLRPVPEGELVIGTARPVHVGVRSQVWSIELHNRRQQLVCISRLTMAVLRR